MWYSSYAIISPSNYSHRISGIQFAHDATTALKEIDLEIYDRNPSLGGTWYENRYPGYVSLYDFLRIMIVKVTDWTCSHLQMYL